MCDMKEQGFIADVSMVIEEGNHTVFRRRRRKNESLASLNCHDFGLSKV